MTALATLSVFLPLARTLMVMAFFGGMPLTCQATIKSYHDLSEQQRLALTDSQERLGRLDTALQAIDQNYARKKISAREHLRCQTEFTAFIAEEAEFQNALLIRPHSEYEADQLMKKILKYTVVIPLEVACLAAESCLRAGGSFSP